MKRTITSSFFTTTNVDSFIDALRFLCTPSYWNKFKQGEYVRQVEEKLSKYLNIERSKDEKITESLRDGDLSHVTFDGKNGSSVIFPKKHPSNIISFYNARSAIYHGLKLLGIGTGDEVIIQAYTCISVPNSIIQTGAKPIYVDIQPDSLNMDPHKIEAKITDHTKAIMIQHTFGTPADIDQIQKICKKYNLFLIEDCAHSLGAEYDGQKVGTFGDIAVFSFGRDKVISTVNGGFLLINNPKYFDKISKIKTELKDVPLVLILKNLYYLLISYLAYKSYDFFNLGKVLIMIAKKFKLIPEILSCNEKSCNDTTFFYRYPNALAYIGLREIDKIDRYNRRRIEIARRYEKVVSDLGLDINNIKFPTTNHQSLVTNIYLRFVIQTDRVKELLFKYKQHNILLGDRYRQVIAPAYTNLENAGYKVGSCPVAEKVADQTLNLPCHPNMSDEDVQQVIKVCKSYKSL